MQFEFNVPKVVRELLQWITNEQQQGAIVLTPSNFSCQAWADVAQIPENSEVVETYVEAMQKRKLNGPIAFANRYDGIDLPGDSCRLLVMEGLPAGTSDYELLRAATLYGSATINRMLAQRIEQGIGRGARGAGDHCVVLLLGADLAGWIAKDANFRLLTNATKVQLDIGSTISKEVKDVSHLKKTIALSIERDAEWIDYHAVTLDENMSDELSNSLSFEVAAAERKAFNNWADGYFDNAISRLNQAANSKERPDEQTLGWLLQLAARIADNWGQGDLSGELQKAAFGANRNLLRPRVRPPYRQLPAPGIQGAAIASKLRGYRIRRGLMQHFDRVVSMLSSTSTANQFEQALADLGEIIGLTTERFDDGGEGPDVLWLLPENQAFIIEAKSKKLERNLLTKEEHGQLLVAEQWFKTKYQGYSSLRVCVHPTNLSTVAASACESFALTLERLTALIADARILLSELCESQLTDIELEALCQELIEKSPIRSDRLKAYLTQFVDK